MTPRTVLVDAGWLAFVALGAALAGVGGLAVVTGRGGGLVAGLAGGQLVGAGAVGVGVGAATALVAATGFRRERRWAWFALAPLPLLFVVAAPVVGPFWVWLPLAAVTMGALGAPYRRFFPPSARPPR